MATPPPPSSRPLRIFLVENHPDTLEYMQMYLEMLGHVVSSADSVAGALGALPQADCEVLISDIGLPDGNGWELLRQVQGQLSHSLYAIAMSGFGMGTDHRRSQEAGYRHHLLKPIDLKQLATALEEAARELPVAH